MQDTDRAGNAGHSLQLQWPELHAFWCCISGYGFPVKNTLCELRSRSSVSKDRLVISVNMLEISIGIFIDLHRTKK